MQDDFGIVRLSVGYQQKTAITLDQVSARFVDDTMRGDYQYAGLRLMLVQIVDGDQQVFIAGEDNAAATLTLR